MVPAARTKRRGIAQATLDFIGQRHRFDDSLAGCVGDLADGENGCQVVRRMCRLFREICIIEVQVADQGSIGEGG